MHIVLGYGDGTLYEKLLVEAQQTGRRVVIAYIHTEPFAGYDGYRLCSPADVQAMVHHLFGNHMAACALVNAEVHVQHPLANEDQEFARQVFTAEFVGHAINLTSAFGNSTLDGLTGLYNAAMNAETLLPLAGLEALDVGQTPVVSVGAGPSVGRQIEELRACQGRAIIVASDAATGILRKHGIKYDIVTPLERLNSTAQKCEGDHGNAIFAGLPVVPPAAVAAFNRHVLVGKNDVEYAWLGIPGDPNFSGGSSTGTLSVAVALAITKGPVYLVGHDCCYEGEQHHADGAEVSKKVHKQADTVTVNGNDGKPRQAPLDWSRFAGEIGMMCYEREVYNVSAHLGMGMCIQHTEAGELPTDAPLHEHTFGEIPRTGEERLANWQERASHLTEDWETFREIARLAQSFPEFDIERMNPRNLYFFAYLLRPLLGCMSILKGADWTEGECLEMGRARVANIGKECLGVFEEIASKGAVHVGV